MVIRDFINFMFAFFPFSRWHQQSVSYVCLKVSSACCNDCFHLFTTQSRFRSILPSLSAPRWVGGRASGSMIVPIRIICPRVLYPLILYFYIGKNWGLQGYSFVFLFLLIEALLTCIHNLCFEQK